MRNPIGKRIVLSRSKTKRLFLAIPLPSAWQEMFVAVQHDLRARQVTGPIKTRWTPRENFHITVLFIGTISTKAVPQIITFLREFTVGIKPFRLLFRHVEIALPHDPKMVWVTFVHTKDFRDLVSSLRKAMRKFFHSIHVATMLHRDHEAIAHVMLARVNGDTKARGIIPVHLVVPAALSVTSLILYSSETKPEGSVYHKIATFRLSA